MSNNTQNQRSQWAVFVLCLAGAVFLIRHFSESGKSSGLSKEIAATSRIHSPLLVATQGGRSNDKTPESRMESMPRNNQTPNIDSVEVTKAKVCSQNRRVIGTAILDWQWKRKSLVLN
ncbi:MAG: hypothetical protein ACRD2L_08480, partial [Terriglobia bacterium]